MAQLDVAGGGEGDDEIEAPREVGHAWHGGHAEMHGGEAATSDADDADGVDVAAHDEQ